MKIPKGFLFALIIIIITSFVAVGFSQEDKKQSTPQEKTTIDQKPSEKDLKAQEEKKVEKKKVAPSEEAQEKYDEAELLRESQRNLDRSLSTLNIVATLMGVLVALLTAIIIIAVAIGIFEYRKYRTIIRRAKKSAKIIEDLENKVQQRVSNINKDISKFPTLDFIGKPPPELIEKLAEHSRRLDFFEQFGLPIKSEDYINRGFDFINKSKYEPALVAFENAVSLELDNFRAWLGKGMALNKLGKHEESLKVSEKLIELNPREAVAWNNKSASLINLERFEEALTASEEAIKRIPHYAGAWNNKGTALMGLKRYDETLKALMEALNLDSRLDDAWYNLACIFSINEDRENMLTCLEKAIELSTEYKEEARKDEDFREYWEDEEFKKITS